MNGKAFHIFINEKTTKKKVKSKSSFYSLYWREKYKEREGEGEGERKKEKKNLSYFYVYWYAIDF